MKTLNLLILFFSTSVFAANENPYTVDCYLKPCELRGDFDGNGKADRAVLVKNKDGQKGLQIELYGIKKPSIVGAGYNIGNGGNDYAWMDKWSLHKGTIAQGAGEGPPPSVKGDSILIEKTGSASAMIYWDGKKFLWYQQGD
jgi:hypothetical protein